MTDAELVERAVRAAGHYAEHPMLRWAWVMRAFSCGSTSAHELCLRFDLDPDDMLGAREEEEEKGTDMRDIVREATAELERDLIKQALEESEWSITVTARKLKISITSLREKIDQFKLGEERV
jgi:DNA-binding NtrC family response regulator